MDQHVSHSAPKCPRVDAFRPYWYPGACRDGEVDDLWDCEYAQYQRYETESVEQVLTSAPESRHTRYVLIAEAGKEDSESTCGEAFDEVPATDQRDVADTE